MNAKEDMKWQALLASSSPAFTGEAIPPYGFLTSTMARLKEQKREQEQIEKISLRAIFASMATLVLTVSITLVLHFQSPRELEPGVRSLIQAENIQVS